MQETRRAMSEGAERLIDNPTKVLDHGFVYLVDYMGNDLSIEQAARTSYGPETKSVSSSTGLIRYLMRHRHTTPVEMIELKFHLKMPIFVARQWMRHRTASINEVSARYSVLPSEFYVPQIDAVNKQSSVNNQGRGELLAEEDASEIQRVMKLESESAYDHYEWMINEHGLARESARAVLPVSVYTEFYWKINMHNLLHFLSLRLDNHAQFEIREYAKAIDAIVKEGWPITHLAFQDYVKDSMSFSRLEVEALSSMLNSEWIDSEEASSMMSKREKAEFSAKIDRLLA